MYKLWSALADYVREEGIEVLFGTASFNGTDPQALAQPLSFLYHNHLAPHDLRPRAKDGHYTSMNILAPEAIDRKTAMLTTPALIKAYLRLGGMVGDGAFVDVDFNTVDVCLVVDTARVNARTAQIYTGATPA